MNDDSSERIKSPCSYLSRKPVASTVKMDYIFSPIEGIPGSEREFVNTSPYPDADEDIDVLDFYRTKKQELQDSLIH